MELERATWPEVADASTDLAVLPVGSTEQHGPHAALGTDSIAATAVARAGVERFDGDVVVGPTLPVGVSAEHRQFPGTMWVDPGVFRDYVESLSRNLTAHGIDRIVYVNAHGGNVAHLREVGRRLHEDATAYAIEWMWDESIPDLIEEVFETPGPHGGPKETAMIMHIAEELVREDRLEEAHEGGATFDYDAERVHGATTFYDCIENSPNGVFGDQTDATPEIGAELFEAATEQLVALLEWLDEQPFEDLMPEPRLDSRSGSDRETASERPR